MSKAIHVSLPLNSLQRVDYISLQDRERNLEQPEHDLIFSLVIDSCKFLSVAFWFVHSGTRTPFKKDGLLVGNFEKNRYEEPRLCFVGMALKSSSLLTHT